MFAAKGAIAAQRQGKFWEMTDIMYKNMRALDESKIKEYAKELGLNTSRFDKDYADASVEAEVKQHMAEAKKIGVRGTPAFYINGKVMPPQGRRLEGLKELIAKELKK